MIDQIYWILFSIPSVLIACTVHEYAHALAAYRLGDFTAKMNGRMTLNPLAHIDPVGAIMMVIARIGWSKPVPINEYNFENPVRGTALTAFAGPLSNLLLALLTAIPFRIVAALGGTIGDMGEYITAFLLTFMMVNISLAVFNLLPIPPLDGHKIARAFLPESIRPHWESLQKFGMWIIVIMFFPLSPLYSVTVSMLSVLTGSILNFLVG